MGVVGKRQMLLVVVGKCPIRNRCPETCQPCSSRKGAPSFVELPDSFLVSCMNYIASPCKCIMEIGGL